MTDLSSLDFDQWLKFLFDHPVSDLSWHIDVISASDYVITKNAVMLEYLSRLFKDPSVLGDYSPGQLEQALWALISNEPPFLEQLWNEEIPLALRKECIESMADLYEKLFAIHPLGESPYSAYMWWDLLTWHYDLENGIPDDTDDAAIQQTIHNTLCRILMIPSDHCVKAALHGLGHLKHPQGPGAIDDFLAKRHDLSKELRDYALQCKEGRIQ